ncbi:MAG: DUF4168 domain-containing protein [Leptolyngbyaceae cyanobacterium bins.302]|nr:DUF4168 domain-containing protein [Leptolyngbyaceae cyanobacterium bins.302]
MLSFSYALQRVISASLLLCFAWMMVPTSSGFAQELLLDPRNVSAEQRVLGYPGLDSNNIPSEKVSQFVQACLQVVTLIERRESDLQATETEAESVQIEQEIEAEALAIIEKNGLTRQEYLQLLGLANTDPEFGERVAVQLQETSG